MTTVIDGIGGFASHVGQHLGYSRYMTITQETIGMFADATRDHQWIHLDAERAADGPFGTTIAHGYLTLALGTALLDEIVEVRNVGMAVNYGANKVRFPSPVKVDSQLRAGASLDGLEEIAGGVQATITLTFEVEGQSKPACVAEVLFRYYA